MQIIITCEHGGNKVPARFRKLFDGKERLLNSHRGYDRYALPLARELAQTLNAPFFYAEITRLLIDLNRSPHHPKLFSSISARLGAGIKRDVINKYYIPYRNAVTSTVTTTATKGITTLHIAIHSFAPVMNGQRKNADIGLLYDPAREREKVFCVQWQENISKKKPVIRIRRNYPYLGKADGLVTHLRKRFPPDLYAGVELEINQKIMKRRVQWKHILCDTLPSMPIIEVGP
jgi:predicted N-formylglutamate amidohydrolase